MAAVYEEFLHFNHTKQRRKFSAHMGRFNPTKPCSRSPQPTGRSSVRFPTRAASLPGVAISPRPRGRRRCNPEKRPFHTHRRAETPPKNAPEAHSPQVDRPLNARTRAANFLRVVTNGSVFFLMRVLFFRVVVTHYKKLRDTLRQTRLQLNSAKFKPGALFLMLISLCSR